MKNLQILKNYQSTLILSLTLLLFSACSQRAPVQPGKRPNVIFIMADDQRSDMLSTNGNPYVKTPHLDRLAAEGCNFKNAFTVSGVCSPSRADFFSGKYAHQCGAPQIIWDNHTFRMNETPFPALLHNEGYYSAHIGKWHLGEGQKQKEGYDYWAGFEWLGSFFNTTVHVNGKVEQHQGFSDDILAGMAADRIQEMATMSQPFCLFVGLKAPHLPFSFPERYNEYLDDVNIPEPASIDEDYDESGRAPIMKTNVIKVRTFQGGIPMFGSWENYVKSYYRSSQALDDAVGTILEAIDKAGITNETIVIYSSDQGYTLGEHGMTEKHYGYEQVMRIPMIIRYPDMIQPGITPPGMALNIDVAPTVLDLCGVEPPAEMTGKSWRPLLEDGGSQAGIWREDFLFEYWDYRPILPSQLAVRSDRYKLITYQDFPEQELYDLEKDPEENHNVIHKPEYVEIKRDMQKRLQRLIGETGWSQRRFLPVNNCYAIGPLSKEEADEAREMVFGEEFNPKQEFEIGGENRSWQKIGFGSDGSLHIVGTIPDTPDHVMLLSIPVARLADRDPHAILDMRPARATRAWFDGEMLWECKDVGNLGLSYYNFPLPAEKNVIRLEMSCEGAEKVKMTVNAPEGSVGLL
ncbi:MAG: sulfatase-like hydrolase/transferase [Bacteroidetes bacterium]|nr:sulfatase-like hydrolase/transferase [Bacteroidota bacterium]